MRLDAHGHPVLNNHNTTGTLFLLHLRIGPKAAAKEWFARDALDDRRHAPHLFSHFGSLLGLDYNFGQVRR